MCGGERSSIFPDDEDSDGDYSLVCLLSDGPLRGGVECRVRALAVILECLLCACARPCCFFTLCLKNENIFLVSLISADDIKAVDPRVGRHYAISQTSPCCIF